ncbi:cytidine deaminase [candidate division KSB3 bacterium]|uniref:Cytidine deaminase n=1 Tax=candidate division KSB3 bacterium TaxID=2044937 RepID=A0A2G6KDC0_9BACT|nr:MAG: cytidine deaminase [candidate division KSB3 bacterium]
MYEALIEQAKQARENAYTPYSGFNVGAAVRTRNGKIFQGCNVENSSYGATICAERVALFAAYAYGEREIEALAIVTDTQRLCPPCGMCRQVIIELGGDIDIILANLHDEQRVIRASDLLPEAFTHDFFA